MQAKIATYGTPPGHRLSLAREGTQLIIRFLGRLQSTDNILGPWTDLADTSPYAITAASQAQYYRAWENESSLSTSAESVLAENLVHPGGIGRTERWGKFGLVPKAVIPSALVTLIDQRLKFEGDFGVARPQRNRDHG
jgi:hypothetical protein